ncbi:MAG TPA: hypothetical protein DEF42_03055 [Desulfosporosinus sp.]|nr:hypothetical protein [Desulfosporosinus sp.]
MHYKMMSSRKGLSIAIIVIGLLLSSASMGFAGESDSSGGHGGMDMGGSSTTHSEPKPNEVPKETTNSQPEDNHSSPDSGHEATPDMDPNMPGHVESSDIGTESSDGHGGSSGGHGGGASDPEGVNWPVVWGFAGINALVVAIAGILKLKQ